MATLISINTKTKAVIRNRGYPTLFEALIKKTSFVYQSMMQLLFSRGMRIGLKKLCLRHSKSMLKAWGLRLRLITLNPPLFDSSKTFNLMFFYRLDLTAVSTVAYSLFVPIATNSSSTKAPRPL